MFIGVVGYFNIFSFNQCNLVKCTFVLHVSERSNIYFYQYNRISDSVSVREIIINNRNMHCLITA